MNKIKILRDLEYLAGGLTTMRVLYKDGNNTKLFDLMEDWNDILINVIDQIAKENEDAQNA